MGLDADGATEAQALALAELEKPWVRREVFRRCPEWMWRYYGGDDLFAEAAVVLTRSAAAYLTRGPEYAAVPFGAFATIALRRHLKELRRVCRTRLGVWRWMPYARGDDGDRFEAPAPLSDTLADHRPPPGDPLHTLWDSDEVRAGRRRLPLRDRVFLRLRVLHGLTQAEIAALLGLSFQRAAQIEEKIRRRLCAVRRRAGAGPGR